MNQKELLIISITVFLTIVAWMIIDLYQIQSAERKESINPVPVSEIPIQISVFEELEKKSL